MSEELKARIAELERERDEFRDSQRFWHEYASLLAQDVARAERLAEAVEKAGTYYRTIGVDQALAAFRSTEPQPEGVQADIEQTSTGGPDFTYKPASEALPRPDTVRLDWLNEHGGSLYWFNGTWAWADDPDEYTGHTLREAIDAAMKGESDE
jgi:hypothetical protein